MITFAGTEAKAQNAGDAVLIDTDFGAEGQRAEQSSARVRGSLPAPWRDTSDWARAWVNYRRATEKGRGFASMEVARLESGRAQMAHLLPALRRDELLTLEMTLRGTHELPLTFGLRQQGPPYEYVWRQQMVPDADWQELRWTFKAPHGTEPIMFLLEASAPGRVDIARIRLGRTSPARVTREWKEKRSPGASRNLMMSSHLPLGLPSGWWFHPAQFNWQVDYGAPSQPMTAENAAKVESDNSIPGPSGAPSLRIAAPHGFGLYSAPFGVPLPFETHVASFHIKGQGRGTCIVWGDGRELGRRDFNLKGEDWRRQEITFKPDAGIRVYALRWEGAGTFWIDGVQVEEGEAATPLASPMPAEIALASESAGGAPFNVQFLQDAPAVQWCVTGLSPNTLNLDTARLRFQVVNLYGESLPLPSVRLAAEFLQRGQVRYDVFPRRMAGAFRVEAWIEDERGERLSRIYEIVINRLHQPRHWGRDAPDSPFGTHLLSTERDIAMAKAIGVNWVRLHDIGTDLLGWHFLEPQPGVWQFRDNDLFRYRRGHLKVLGVLQTTPAWASLLKTAQDPYYDRYYQPRDPAQFGQYARTVAARYKDVIDAYEVWSEPWNFPWFPVRYDDSATTRVSSDAATPPGPAGYRTSAQPQADYARLMREAYQNVKEVAPNATILGFNTTTVEAIPDTRLGGNEWTRGVQEQGGLNACDVISYHHYMSEEEAGALAQGVRPGIERGFQTAIGSLLSEGRAPKPVWLSEGSPITEVSRETGFYRYTLPFPTGEALTKPSDRLCRFVTGLLAQNVQKVFLYSMHAGHFFGQPNEFGLLMHRDGSLHPTGVAFSHMAWQLDGTRFARTVKPGTDITAYGFEGNGRSVVVLAKDVQATRPYALPLARARIEQAEFTDLWGNELHGTAELNDTIVYLSGNKPLNALERVLAAMRSR
jgi:hypothetical protein